MAIERVQPGMSLSGEIPKAKNIVICCDGTGNEFGDQNSNVVKLYRTLIRGTDKQLTYYHPGVGTMGAKNALSAAGKAWTRIRGLAFGYGLSENIADAYQFLMHNFVSGDRLFIFGFSRGAYTARALCGMLEMFGLLSSGNEELIPYAMRLFKSSNSGLMFRIKQRFTTVPNKFRTAAGFKSTFCKECKPHFLGLWDTVSSVGWILDPIGLKPGRLPYTFALNEVSMIRHAVSVDERRAFFRQNLVEEDPTRDIKQVWFPGVHSDVGGSYPEAESGLSKISLRWMLIAASQAGLLVDDALVTRVLGGDPGYARPSCTAMIHNSLTLPWWIGEFWPKWTKRRVSPLGQEPEKFRGWPRMNLFRRRTINGNEMIHQSVIDREKANPKYKPHNLPLPPRVENDPGYQQIRLHMKPNQEVTVAVHARLKWNDTGVELHAGERYSLTAIGHWSDATINSDADGYESPNILFRSLQRLRRMQNANWFALIGAVGINGETAFTIGKCAEITATVEGVLHCFANDLSFMYGNNSGFIKLTIKRLD